MKIQLTVDGYCAPSVNELGGMGIVIRGFGPELITEKYHQAIATAQEMELYAAMIGLSCLQVAWIKTFDFTTMKHIVELEDMEIELITDNQLVYTLFLNKGNPPNYKQIVKKINKNNPQISHMLHWIPDWYKLFPKLTCTLIKGESTEDHALADHLSYLGARNKD